MPVNEFALKIAMENDLSVIEASEVAGRIEDKYGSFIDGYEAAFEDIASDEEIPTEGEEFRDHIIDKFTEKAADGLEDEF